jgi:valyl-tRNA synthetase
MVQLPKRYDHRDAERRWRERWESEGIYLFDAADDRPVFSIDTPPPTVSGLLHIGHVFSYTHTDLVARFQRMRGRNVFYPMGWDDNGLPSERRVQNLLKVRCDPTVPYNAGFRADRESEEVMPVSRRNFLELCARVTAEDEVVYEELWRHLGLSVDWKQTYATIDEHSRLTSQRAFLDLVEKGEAYSADAPTMWDVDFGTAVAQAEAEDREVTGREFMLRFGVEGGGTLRIMTTRPELLGACVAVVVHPDDDRYRRLVGGHAITPGYLARVPIMAHGLAEPDKGTGVVMVCTFGDGTDVTWWEELGLETRVVLGRDGRVLPVEWGHAGWESLAAATAQVTHERVAGLSAEDAKRAMADVLREGGAAADGTGEPPLEGEPRAVTQSVRYYEKGERPLEILPARQWFIRLLDKKDALIAQGRRVRWHPEWMRARYETWVEGLRYDWCVSRQRYHGVPIPVWYRIGAEGRTDYAQPIFPARERLPVDPMAEAPQGYEGSQRGEPGGFTADPDVLDTWATSSLTPQITTRWAADDDRFGRLYPMDLRPQAHEIIRTWAFYTITRAYMMDGRVPWKHIAISGWVTDPDRKKMSKSTGNVVTPMGLIEQYGADAIRYWAARARLGTDTAYDESTFQVGKRLVTKLFNAAKLIVGRLEGAGAGAAAEAPVSPLDLAHLALLRGLVDEATGLMEAFDTAGALERAERWFWGNLCDNYLEATKARAYRADGSALATWRLSLSVVLRLLAPFVPYITEEAWSWLRGPEGGSVHRAPWPSPGEVPDGGEPALFRAAAEALSLVRKRKSEANVSLRTAVGEITVTGPGEMLALLEACRDDLLSAASADRMEFRASGGEGLSVEFDLP